MTEEQKKFKLGNAEYLAIVIVAVLALLTIYNIGKISTVSGNSVGVSLLPGVSASEIIPSGTPETYGGELNIKYDDVSPVNPQKADATISIMSNFDKTITLEGADLQRYIGIASRISCEYCCGAKSIIFDNGQPACGCAHSYAMRGLAKYLITNHGSEYTDDEILTELAKWKVLFFPDIHKTKAAVLEQQGIEVNYINLASNAYRGIEKGASGGSMVGGC